MSTARPQGQLSPAEHTPAALDVGLAVGLGALVLAVFGQVGAFGFVNLDDQLYAYGNLRVQRGLSLEGVRWAFTTFHTGNYHPLTWLSLMLDVQLFGPGPGPHHLVNVALHLGCTWLLFAVLGRLTGHPLRSALVAALFAVHPLHVESVAWISERKDVLSTIFGLAAMGAYLAWVRRPALGRYAALVALFAASLLAKAMWVSLPALLLVLDVWPLRRWAPLGPEKGRGWRPLAEKAPLFAMAFASAAVAIPAQASGQAVVSLAKISMLERLSNALVSCVLYLVQAVWPAGLAAFYPHPAIAGGGTPGAMAGGAALVLAAITVALVRERSRRPYLLVGWLWYLGTLVPTLGLLQVGAQARADRYTYLPLVGLFLAGVWAGAELLARLGGPRRLPLAAAAALIAALSAACWVQVRYWRDSVTLLERAVAVTDRNWQAFAGLADAYAEQGQLDRAIAAGRTAVEIVPSLPNAWNSLGVSYGQLGNPAEAMRCFEQAVRWAPAYADGWYNLGIAYGGVGRHAEARDCFQRAVRAAPEHAAAWKNLVIANLRLQDRASAAEALARLRQLDPAGASALEGR